MKTLRFLLSFSIAHLRFAGWRLLTCRNLHTSHTALAVSVKKVRKFDASSLKSVKHSHKSKERPPR